jgi:tetratricopeptide (TPR) repeat protein
MVPSWRGETKVALLRFRDGLAGYDRELVPDNRFVRRWHGALLARAGEYAQAIEVLEPEVNLDEGLLPGAPTPQLDGAHALAWAYLHSGADAKARALLSALWRLCDENPEPGLAYDSDQLHHCAGTALFQGRRDVALDWFERAVTAGWREYYFRQNDLYWAALADDPRYQALMAKVKADVDRQGREIARIDSEDDFVERLDAAVAARAAVQPAGN